jgi:hypothetical protein
MTVYDDAESGGFRLQIKFAEIMQNINSHPASLDDFRFWQSARPRLGVDVTADRGYRGNLRQRFEDFERADIAGVKDAVGPTQSFDGFGSQQAVGIGDYSEGYSFLSHRLFNL